MFTTETMYKGSSLAVMHKNYMLIRVETIAHLCDTCNFERALYVIQVTMNDLRKIPCPGFSWKKALLSLNMARWFVSQLMWDKALFYLFKIKQDLKIAEYMFGKRLQSPVAEVGCIDALPMDVRTIIASFI